MGDTSSNCKEIEEKYKKMLYTIMSTSFHVVHLKNQRQESYVLANGQAKLYPAWWEVDKVSVYFRLSLKVFINKCANE